MWTWISTAFGAIGSVFSYMGQRLGLMNRPDMVERAKAQTEVKEGDRVHEEIKRGDIKSIRNDLSS